MNLFKTLILAGVLLVTSFANATHTVPSTKDFAESEWYSAQCAPHHLMNPDVMSKVQQLRDYMNQPLYLTSAYRCPEHPIEAAKIKPGQHSLGLAVDIFVTDSTMAGKIIAYAISELDVKGFAYSYKGNFVHLDWRTGDRVTWKY
jgi:uncharacterized protein YcbK (DUF882 family)